MHRPRYLVLFALSLMAVSVIAPFWYFRRKRWL